MAVENVVYGNNADLIREVCNLYCKDGDEIADVTYGKGNFWKKIPEEKNIAVIGSDMVTVPNRRYDFTNLPYEDNSFDVVVLDPPYIHHAGNHMTDANYQNAATTKGFDQKDIMKLYHDGMKEASRTAKRQVWVKGKDQVQGGIQRWSSVALHQIGVSLGLYPRDMFYLVTHSARAGYGRWNNQYHARKPISFLWVFDVDNNSKLQKAMRDLDFLQEAS